MALKKNLRSDATHCVHAGEERHGRNAAITTDISQTSVFVLAEVDELRRYAEGKSDAYVYSRYGNPTITAAEEKIAALENGEACLITSSGMAAILTAVLSTCSAGDEIVSMLDVYGGTLKLFRDVLPRYGVKTRFVPYPELDKIEKYISKQSKMLFLETPTNPTLRCIDLERLIRVGSKRTLCVVVDNTFATPILQKPLELGADVAMHSATKYLGGHSDVTAGALVGEKSWIESARKMMIASGTCLDPFAAYLLIRGLKTLELRVQRACANAHRVCEFLEGHSKVARVMYPGTGSNPGYEFARRQMSDFGMMVSFEIKGGGRSARNFIDRLELWYLAASLGGVESTVSYPVLSSHVGLSREDLQKLDVSDATVRLSVGIESADDLIADLNRALAKA